MYSDKNRFLISISPLVLLSISFYESFIKVIFTVIQGNLGGWITSLIYLAFFSAGLYFIIKSLYKFLMYKKISKDIYIGYIFLLFNFYYDQYEFKNFPIFDLHYTFKIFTFGIGINFIMIGIVVFYRFVYHNAPSNYKFEINNVERKKLE